MINLKRLLKKEREVEAEFEEDLNKDEASTEIAELLTKKYQQKR